MTTGVKAWLTSLESKNPNGYCNHGPNGLTCPVGVARVGTTHDQPAGRVVPYQC